MSDKLPNLIDPIYFVNHLKQIRASVNQSEFSRLAEQLVDGGQNDRSIEVALQFFYDKALKFPAFELQLKTALLVQCQRSLQPFDIEVDVKIKGVFAESLALTGDLPNEVEVYELGEERISLYDLIEDELLLSIPLAPINESAALNWQDTSLDESFDAEGEKSLRAIKQKGQSLQEKPNPFAALQVLKSESKLS